MSKYNQVHLTFYKENGRLLHRGQHSVAVMGTGEDGKITTLVPTKTEKEPETETITKVVVLGKEFVNNCLENPAKISQFNGKRYKNQSVIRRISDHAEELALEYGFDGVEIELSE